MKPIEVVEELFEAVEARDEARVRRRAAEDILFEDMALESVHRGKAAFLDYMNDLWAGLPDFHVRSSSLTEDRGVVAAELKLAGTHKGPFLDLPASHKVVLWSAAAFYTVDDALQAVRREAYYYDLESLRVQCHTLKNEADREV